MNAMLKPLKPYLLAYSTPETDEMTSHKEELWFYLDYEKALLCGERVIVGEKPIRLENGRVLIAASAVEDYFCKAFAAEVVDCRRYIPVEAAVEAGLHAFYNYDIGVLVLGKAPMAYKNEDKDSLRTQILRLGDLIFRDPSADKIMKDIVKTHGEISHPFFTGTQAGYDEARPLNLNENPTAEKEITCRAWVMKTLNEGISHFDRFFTVD